MIKQEMDCEAYKVYQLFERYFYERFSFVYLEDKHIFICKFFSENKIQEITSVDFCYFRLFLLQLLNYLKKLNNPNENHVSELEQLQEQCQKSLHKLGRFIEDKKKMKTSLIKRKSI